MDILCNEMMACAIIGVGDAVYETIVTNFPAFSEAILREQTEHPDMDFDYRDLQKIVEISKKEHDPVKRIAAFIGHVNNLTLYEGSQRGNHLMNLLSQCLQHTATFLNAHPDLIDSFLETVDLSSSPSDTPFRHDRHLNLISALSQSSSPLFTKLSESLLDPTFPLRSLLSPRSFTDPASSLIRMASTNPAFFRRFVETHVEHILDIAISTAVSSVRVVSGSSSEPHCLDFGRATQNWVVLLKAIAEMKMDLSLPRDAFNPLPHFLLTLLVLSAASTHDELSTAAVSVFSNQFGLSTPHTEALLFATPTTFPISDAFTSRQSHETGKTNHIRTGTQSICAEARCCAALMSRLTCSEPFDSLDLALMLGIPFASCLVNAFHSTTTLPHSFPFFSPELCRLSEQPSVWNDSSRPSALTALTALADIEINLAFSHSFWQPNVSQTDEGRRETILIHLFPFLGPESQTQFLSSFNTWTRSKALFDPHTLTQQVECLVEMATVNSYNTPIALLTQMRKVVERFYRAGPVSSSSGPVTHSFGRPTPRASQFETSIAERLRTAEGDKKWKLLTQTVVVSSELPEIENELMNAENDAQALLILSVPKIRSTPNFNFHLDPTPDAFNRVVELAGHFNNLPLVAEALAHFGNSVEEMTLPPPSMRLIEPNPDVRDLVINTLRTIAPLRREGVEEGCAVGNEDVTSQIVDSCLKVFRFLMKSKSFDPTPVIDSLVSLAVTTDLSLLHSILLALQRIEKQTRNTTTPFSISRATAPFRGIHESSVTQQPLPSIVASILLSANLEEIQSLHQIFRKLKENLVLGIAKEAAKTICLILEKRNASSSQALKSDDPFVISLTQKDRHISPQQLFLTLHKMIFPGSTADIPASTLLPLAPFLTRVLTIVVPSSPDRVTIRSQQDEHSQLLDIFLSLVLSLINTDTPSTLSTPPLSSLLSVLSIALVRLDSIPSSLNHHSRFRDLFEMWNNRFNPQVKQFVLALSSEGMEDRSDLALDSFSLDFLNKWRGANTQHPDDRTIPNAVGFGGLPVVRFNPPFGVFGQTVHQPLNPPPAPFGAHPFGGFGFQQQHPIGQNRHQPDVFRGQPRPRNRGGRRQRGGFGDVPRNQHDDQFHHPLFGGPSPTNPQFGGQSGLGI
ncbi:hypothetical protein BLNAU_14149 [Blattamonas nauphoetae]|uniref:Uncharacterized protein n=1 Tax=Blattamonas nauphoetae TaxID=2049346 RepID=A0ABQ9XI12_9EUKA|nr:hypothetical protein BLNAU_14149 [Blattamonas nauphoetae]